MGLFNKTEEELRIIEEKKQLKELRDSIRSNNNLIEVNKIALVGYVDGILNGKKNDFFENDFLIRVLLQLDANEYYDHKNVEAHLDKIIRCLRDFLPKGINTENYEEIKEYIINDFVGVEGYINKGIYDYSLYSLFKTPTNFIRVMKTINKNEVAVQHFKELEEYIKKTAKYTVDEETFVKGILSTINALDEGVLNVSEFLDEELAEDKKRIGIYSISHEDIMTASRTMDRIDAKIEEIDNIISAIEEKAKDLKANAEAGVKKVSKAEQDALRELKSYKATLEKELKILLEEHLETIKIELNEKADSVFEVILDKYQEQLQAFRRESKNFSLESTRKLTQLKDETDKSLNQLRDYVDKSPELHACLKEVEESAEVRDKLFELIEKQKESLITPSNQGTIVQGISRIVVPESPKVNVPETIIPPTNVEIIPSYVFSNAEEYHNIMRNILSRKESYIANGEIFHEKIDEIIECLLVGDWPYMFGPSGAGKGFIVNQIGKLIDQKVIDGGKIGEVHTVLGYIDAQGRFRSTPALEACTDGGLIFFDEFDNGNPDTRVALNTMYSNLREKIQNPSSEQYIRFAGEIDVPINPNMRMIAAGNTDGTGSDELFTDRYPTDESIKERYKPIYVDYDNRVEKSILKDYEAWYKFFVSFRQACNEYAESQGMQSAPGNASTRDAADILRDIKLNAKTLDQMMSEYFVQIKESDYREALIRKIAKEYNVDLNKTDPSGYSDFTGPLEEAKSRDLARQFIKRSRKSIRG